MADFHDSLVMQKPVTFKDVVTFEIAPTIGNGTGSPSTTLDKVEAGTADVVFKNAGVVRWQLREDASENLAIRRYNSSGVFVDQILVNQSTGAVTLPSGVTITAGGLIVTAGGVTVSAGGATITGGLELVTGIIKLPLTEYADNAAALVGGLVAGNLYHTAGAVKVVT